MAWTWRPADSSPSQGVLPLMAEWKCETGRGPALCQMFLLQYIHFLVPLLMKHSRSFCQSGVWGRYVVVSENMRKQSLLLDFLGIFNLLVCSVHLPGASGFVTPLLCVLCLSGGPPGACLVLHTAQCHKQVGSW